MFNIRTATLNDLPTLLQFEQAVIEAERPYCPNMQETPFLYYDLQAMINRDCTEVMVAEIVDQASQTTQLVASGYADIRDDRHYLTHDKIGYLGFMYVIPESRGQGVNHLIIDALIKWSHTKGIEHFVLDAFAENTAALRAYEKLGFQPGLLQMRLHKPQS